MTAPRAGTGRRLPRPAVDFLTAVVVGVLTCAATIGADSDHDPGALAFAMILAMAAVLPLRRRSPETTAAATLTGLWTYLYLGLPEGPVYVVPFVAFVLLALERETRTTVIELAVVFVANTLFHAVVLGDLADLWMNAVISLFWVGIAGAIGVAIREAQRARSRERDAERERHRAEERVAMAREIHDVVGHSLAVVSMNAGVALHVLEKRTGAAPGVVEHLRAIRDASTRALGDLRTTLGPLRQGQDPQLRPACTLEDIPALVEDVRKGGMRVECEITGEVGAPPARVGAAAYRVVQESLTNVIRHAGAARASVRVWCGPDGLTVEVADDGRGGAVDPDRPGQGITGMIERVEAQGGAFRAGPGPGGGFEIHADIPYVRSAG